MIAEVERVQEDPLTNTHIVNRGEIAAGRTCIFQTHISSCVSVCLYDPQTGSGAITHISSSRVEDTTPSGRFIKNDGYYYADNAVEGAILVMKKRFRIDSPENLNAVITGGLNREGPVLETLDILEKYNFRICGMDIMRNMYRTVIFEPASGSVTILRRKPFADYLPYVQFRLDEKVKYL